MKKIEKIEDVRPCIEAIQNQVGRCYYRANALREIFAKPPERIDDGPKDLCFFYSSVLAILEDIVKDSGEAGDALSDVYYSEPLKNEEVQS